MYIFDLIQSTQIKFSKKCINSIKDNKENDEGDNNIINNYIILPEEIYLLESCKEKVESQLLENKKGNKLANAFNFFFGGGGDDENKELTEEEKQALNNAFSQDNLINYLTNKKIKDGNNNDNEEKKEEQVIDKFKHFFNNISFNITLNKIELLLNYFYSSHSIYIKNINSTIDINKNNDTKDFQVIIEDIGFDSKISILKNKNNE